MPDTGSLRVTVTDQDGAPLAAKVSVVGFDQSPDPRSIQNLAGFVLGGFVFGSDIKQKGKVIFGVPFVAFADVDGDTRAFPLQPGDYGVVVTHGPEYSAVTERVTISSGNPTSVSVQLAHVIDTTGFVSTDYHVHLINSPDSEVTKDERIVTMLAEGVDYFVASDHDFRTDLHPDIVRLGAQEPCDRGRERGDHHLRLGPLQHLAAHGRSHQHHRRRAGLGTQRRCLPGRTTRRSAATTCPRRRSSPPGRRIA